MNPYQSPARVGDQSKGQGKLLLRRILAIVCWLTAILPVLGFFALMNLPMSIDRRATAPFAFWLFVAVLLGLPAVGLVLLGTASWLGFRWIARAGLAAFLPLVALFIARQLFTQYWK